MKRNITNLWKNIRTFGIILTIFNVVYLWLNKLIGLFIFYCIELTLPDLAPQYRQLKTSLKPTEIGFEFLEGYGNKAEYSLSDEFLRKAKEKQDRCYGFIENDKIVAHGWYSDKPTIVDDGLELSFDHRHVYMYNGFTHPEYRGKRLHSIGMAYALQQLSDEDYKGLISIVDANNYRSLRSCWRMGYRKIGLIYCVSVFGKFISFSTGNVRQYKMNVRIPTSKDL